MDRRTRRSYLRRSSVVAGVALVGCLDRTGSRSPATESPTPTSTPTRSPSESTPTESDELLAWTFETGGPIPTAPAVADGSAFVPSEDGTCYALAEATGEELWRFEAEAPFRAVPLVHDGTVLARSGTYALGADQPLYALDARTGEKRWSYSTEGWQEVVGLREGTVYVATADDYIQPTGQTLFALSLEDGTEEWSAEIGDPSGGIVTDDTVFVPSYGRIYAFDTDTGNRRWAIDVSDYAYRTIAAVGDSLCYVARDDLRGVLHVREAATGDQRWRFDDWFVSSTTDHDGTLVVGGKKVAAFDLETGTPRWQADASGFVPRAPVRDGVIYAGGDESRAIAVSDGSVRWSWTPDVAVRGLVPAGVGHGAAYFDSFREADPRNRYKFAVDTQSGSSRWTFGPETNLTDLTVGDELVVVGGKNGLVYGLGR